jgi:hypothetical protein
MAIDEDDFFKKSAEEAARVRQKRAKAAARRKADKEERASAKARPPTEQFHARATPGLCQCGQLQAREQLLQAEADRRCAEFTVTCGSGPARAFMRK